ncbi:hypothetical protein CWE04_05420 [Thomasclavelia cocleata]|uniref:Cellulose biosynthesis protein BcsQ n=2 Tax=Thomasclavelia cocleata TaxID=69824 RepID=A0A1I0DY66_9FIRM|nr:AAA family ATPase [Thomasclavelia cocleata]MCR1961192.1 AAA family ATPase [Thomasclavelia cocleata]NDO42076.1 AAA family ATPase [Thomasclavelia cocleata]PJN80893.1 hypothetical protein CWE04_05420 [Thomasclavelia cocleata]SET36974.1 Cellulose biosynthesis protein BcsQ [Thomasclavelia cocleata]
MKIKVALLDNNVVYLNKISNALKSNYGQKLDLYIFTSKETLLQSINLSDLHVLIVNKLMFDFQEIADIKIAKGYFSESKEISEINNFKAINKFQKINDFLEEILNLYEECFERISINKTNSNQAKIISYTSFSGGTGTSTIAISEAISKTKKGFKVLYLNLEYFDSTDVYFKNHQDTSFSNVVFLLKKDDMNLASKLEKNLSKDDNGVFYYSSPIILLDKLEINNIDDINKLITALKQMEFDYIIIDRNIDFSIVEKTIFDLSDSLRFVVDGTKIGNYKFLKLINSLSLVDKRENSSICQKIGIIYNKMSSSFNNTIQNKEIPVLAIVNKYNASDDKMLIDEIVSKNVLTNL